MALATVNQLGYIHKVDLYQIEMNYYKHNNFYYKLPGEHVFAPFHSARPCLDLSSIVIHLYYGSVARKD